MEQFYSAAWALDLLALTEDEGDIRFAIDRLNPYDPLSGHIGEFTVERGLRFTDAPLDGETIIIRDDNAQSRLFGAGRSYPFAVRRTASRDRVIGAYALEGVGLDGKAYKGNVYAVPGAGPAVRLICDVGNVVTRGFGLLRDGRFAMAFKIGERQGIGQMTLAEDGSLSGAWACDGVEAEGTESWIPKPPGYLRLPKPGA